MWINYISSDENWGAALEAESTQKNEKNNEVREGNVLLSTKPKEVRNTIIENLKWEKGAQIMNLSSLHCSSLFFCLLPAFLFIYFHLASAPVLPMSFNRLQERLLQGQNITSWSVRAFTFVAFIPCRSFWLVSSLQSAHIFCFLITLKNMLTIFAVHNGMDVHNLHIIMITLIQSSV